MDKLDFASLHQEKLDLIFENIEVLSSIKESDTILPSSFFKAVNNAIETDYAAKMSILNKNSKFVLKELKKDFKQMRKLQKKNRTARREQPEKCEIG